MRKITFRLTGVASLALICANVTTACSSSDSPTADQQGAVSQRERDSGRVIRASDKAREELGVFEWIVSSSSSEGEVARVVGVDAASAAIRAEITFSLQRLGERHHRIEYHVFTPEMATLSVDVQGDEIDPGSVTNTIAGSPVARRVVELASEDMQNAPPPTQARASTSLRQSVTTPMTTGSGTQLTKDAGITLARDAGAPYKRPETCLIDKDGESCAVQFFSTVGMAMLTGVGCALILVPPITAAGAVGCAAGIAGTINAADSMAKSKCKDRPCSAGTSATSSIQAP